MPVDGNMAILRQQKARRVPGHGRADC